MRALIRETDPGDRRFFAEVLREQGFEVEAPAQLADDVPRGDIDLLLVDVDAALVRLVRTHAPRHSPSRRARLCI